MWGKITGKSDTASQDGRRKASSSSARRRESIVSTNSTRKPGRSEDKATPTSRSTYPPLAPDSTVSSYATAPELYRNADSRYESLPESLSRARTEYDERSRLDDDARSTRSRRARSSSRERKKDRKERSRSRDRDDKKKDKKKKDESSGKRNQKDSKSARSEIVDAPSTSRAGEGFSSQIATPGFSAFPGQVGAPVSPEIRPVSALVNDQFPGQNPTEYSAPFQSPFGAAADYYGDQGQSVMHQPGVRPNQPMPNPDPHLMTPTATSNPPLETGQGAANDFYAGKVSPVYGSSSKPSRPSSQTMPGAFEESPPPSKPPRPTFVKPSKTSSSKPSSSSKPNKPGKVSSAATLAGGAALGYAMGHSSSHEQSSSQYMSASGRPTSSFYQQASTGPVGSTDAFSLQAHNGDYNYPSPEATMNVHGPNASSTPSKPGKYSSNSNSNAGLYAAGAAGLAAGAYGLHQHGSHHNSLSTPSGGAYNAARLSPASFGGNATAMHQHHQHRGPVSKFVDWWKDHEDVRKMEEYTEYIGVCRDCFDPRSPATDAPRKHHYHGSRRRSNEHRGSRVDKDSRYYYSSDNERRKSNKAGWIATGLAGAGISKVGKSLWNQGRDEFDDTYSVKSGKYSSRGSHAGRSRSRSGDRKSRTSYGIAGGYEYGGPSHSHRDTGFTSDGKSYKVVRRSGSRSRDRKDEHKIVRRRSRSRSASQSRGYKNGLIGAALGAAVGASASGRSIKHRSRSNSPNRAFVRRRDSGRDRRHDQEGLGTVLGLDRKDKRRSSRRSDASSYVDISRPHRRPSNQGLFAGFFSTPEKKDKHRKVHTHHKTRKGFFNLSNSSASSSDSGLAYGAGFAKSRTSKPKRKSSDEKLKATLVGLGATAAALTAAQHKRGKAPSSGRKPEVVAVSDTRRHHSQRSRDPRASRGSSGTDEDGWESASDVNDSSSVNSGLAFGDYDHKGKGKSTESLVSNDSGTNKWLWRWGSKKKKRPAPPTYNSQQGPLINPGAAAIAGAGAGAAFNRYEGRMSSTSSIPTMQSVYPVPTADPYNFDVSRSSSFPIVSRPDNVPLQQPQPVAPVNGNVLAESASLPGLPGSFGNYVQPNGPPVFSTASNRQSAVVESPRPFNDDRNNRPVLPKHVASSPVSSFFKRDAAIAGVAGVAAAAGAAALSQKRRQSAQSPSSVRFDLSKEERDREHRKRKDEDRDEGHLSKRRETGHHEEREREIRLERERIDAEERKLEAAKAQERERTRRQLEGETSQRSEDLDLRRRREEEDNLKRRRAGEDARIEAERVEAVRLGEQRRREQGIRIQREEEEQKRREQLEAAERVRREEVRRAELERQATAAREASEKAEMDRETERIYRERQQEARAAAERSDAARNERARIEKEFEQKRLDRERLEQEILGDTSLVKSQSTGGTDRSWNVENRERELQDREKGSDWKGAAAVASIGAAAAATAIAASAASSSSSKDSNSKDSKRSDKKSKKSKSKKRESTVQSPHFAEDEHLEMGFDKDYFTKKDAQKKDVQQDSKKPARSMSADDVLNDLNQKYRETAPSQAEFFTPAELKTASPSIVVRSPDADIELPVYSAHDANIALVEPLRQPPYDQPYAFSTGSYSSSLARPREVPMLNLITPTPPASRATSVTTGRSRSPSPVPCPVVEPTKPERVAPFDPSSASVSSRVVKWGANDTFHYVPETPESYREQYMSQQDLDRHAKDFVKSEDRSDPYTSQHQTHSYAASDPNYADNRDRTGKDPESPEEIVSSRRYDPNEKVEESHTPEVQPVVVEPSPRARGGSDSLYQQPFVGSLSDIADISQGATKSDHGFVEAEVTEEAEEFFEASDRSMPGGFIEDEPEPQPEPEPEVPFAKPLNKKEKRKQEKVEKAKRRESADQTSAASDSANASVAEEASAPTREAQTFTTGVDEWEAPMSKKDKKKKKRQSAERDIRDFEPEKNDGPRGGGVGLGNTVAAAAVATVLAGVASVASETTDNGSKSTIDSSASCEGTNGHDQTSTQNGNTNASIVEDERRRSIPSNAFDDLEELADVITPNRKGGSKRRSKNFSPTASPLRSEVGWDDYIGSKAAPSTAGAVTDPPQPISELQSGRSISPDRDTKSETAKSDNYEERRKSSKSKDRDDIYDDTRSVKSESRYDDGRERRRAERREAEENDYGLRSVHEDRPLEDEYDRRRSKHRDLSPDATHKRDDDRIDDGADHKRRHRRRESEREKSPSPTDRHKRSSISSEPTYRYDDDDDKRSSSRHHRRRESEKGRSTSPPDKYKKSSASPEPGDLYESSHKSRRKSKRDSGDFDDAASVVSPPAKYDDDKEKKKGGIFGMLSGLRSTDSLASTSKARSKDSRYEEDDPDKKRKKKHRSSTGASTYGSDDEDRKSERRERRHRSSVAGSSYGSDDDDRRSERRERKKVHDSQDQSFLGERAVETIKLPVNLSTTPAVIKPVPEFHSIEDLYQDPSYPESVPLPTSEPPSPADISLPLATDLPPLPASSPDELAELETPPSLSDMRATSTTAVPFHLRRRPPVSPSYSRGESWPAGSMTSPPASTPEFHRRHSRGSSADMKRQSAEKHITELRPLYLLERNRKVPEIEADTLPSLPSSVTSSRSPSLQGSSGNDSADNWESALEHPDESGSEFFHSPEGSRRGGDSIFGHDNIEDFLDSQQATPKASEFPSDVKQAMRDNDRPPSPHAIAHETLYRALAEEASKQNEAELSIGDAEERSKALFSSETLQNAETAIIVGGSAAAVALELLMNHKVKDEQQLQRVPEATTESRTNQDVSNKNPASIDQSASRDLDRSCHIDDFMSGEPDEQDISLAPSKVATEEPVPAIPTSPSRTSSKKGKKGKKGKGSVSEPGTPRELSREEEQTLREQDAAFGVDSWYEEPSTPKTPKSESEAEKVPPSPTVTSTVPDALMRRGSVGKGKRGKQGKKGKRGQSISEDVIPETIPESSTDATQELKDLESIQTARDQLADNILREELDEGKPDGEAQGSTSALTREITDSNDPVASASQTESEDSSKSTDQSQPRGEVDPEVSAPSQFTNPVSASLDRESIFPHPSMTEATADTIRETSTAPIADEVFERSQSQDIPASSDPTASVEPRDDVTEAEWATSSKPSRKKSKKDKKRKPTKLDLTETSSPPAESSTTPENNMLLNASRALDTPSERSQKDKMHPSISHETAIDGSDVKLPDSPPLAPEVENKDSTVIQSRDLNIDFPAPENDSQAAQSKQSGWGGMFGGWWGKKSAPAEASRSEPEPSVEFASTEDLPAAQETVQEIMTDQRILTNEDVAQSRSTNDERSTKAEIVADMEDSSLALGDPKGDKKRNSSVKDMGLISTSLPIDSTNTEDLTALPLEQRQDLPDSEHQPANVVSSSKESNEDFVPSETGDVALTSGKDDRSEDKRQPPYDILQSGLPSLSADDKTIEESAHKDSPETLTKMPRDDSPATSEKTEPIVFINPEPSLPPDDDVVENEWAFTPKKKGKKGKGKRKSVAEEPSKPMSVSEPSALQEPSQEPDQDRVGPESSTIDPLVVENSSCQLELQVGTTPAADEEWDAPSKKKDKKAKKGKGRKSSVSSDTESQPQASIASTPVVTLTPDVSTEPISTIQGSTHQLHQHTDTHPDSTRSADSDVIVGPTPISIEDDIHTTQDELSKPLKEAFAEQDRQSFGQDKLSEQSQTFKKGKKGKKNKASGTTTPKETMGSFSTVSEATPLTDTDPVLGFAAEAFQQPQGPTETAGVQENEWDVPVKKGKNPKKVKGKKSGTVTPAAEPEQSLLAIVDAPIDSEPILEVLSSSGPEAGAELNPIVDSQYPQPTQDSVERSPPELLQPSVESSTIPSDIPDEPGHAEVVERMLSPAEEIQLPVDAKTESASLFEPESVIGRSVMNAEPVEAINEKITATENTTSSEPFEDEWVPQAKKGKKGKKNKKKESSGAQTPLEEAVLESVTLSEQPSLSQSTAQQDESQLSFEGSGVPVTEQAQQSRDSQGLDISSDDVVTNAVEPGFLKRSSSPDLSTATDVSQETLKASIAKSHESMVEDDARSQPSGKKKNKKGKASKRSSLVDKSPFEETQIASASSMDPELLVQESQMTEPDMAAASPQDATEAPVDTSVPKAPIPPEEPDWATTSTKKGKKGKKAKRGSLTSAARTDAEQRPEEKSADVVPDIGTYDAEPATHAKDGTSNIQTAASIQPSSSDRLGRDEAAPVSRTVIELTDTPSTPVESTESDPVGNLDDTIESSKNAEKIDESTEETQPSAPIEAEPEDLQVPTPKKTKKGKKGKRSSGLTTPSEPIVVSSETVSPTQNLINKGADPIQAAQDNEMNVPEVLTFQNATEEFGPTSSVDPITPRAESVSNERSAGTDPDVPESAVDQAALERSTDLASPMDVQPPTHVEKEDELPVQAPVPGIALDDPTPESHVHGPNVEASDDAELAAFIEARNWNENAESSWALTNERKNARDDEQVDKTLSSADDQPTKAVSEPGLESLEDTTEATGSIEALADEPWAPAPKKGKKGKKGKRASTFEDPPQASASQDITSKPKDVENEQRVPKDDLDVSSSMQADPAKGLDAPREGPTEAPVELEPEDSWASTSKKKKGKKSKKGRQTEPSTPVEAEIVPTAPEPAVSAPIDSDQGAVDPTTVLLPNNEQDPVALDRVGIQTVEDISSDTHAIPSDSSLKTPFVEGQDARIPESSQNQGRNVLPSEEPIIERQFTNPSGAVEEESAGSLQAPETVDKLVDKPTEVEGDTSPFSAVERTETDSFAYPEAEQGSNLKSTTSDPWGLIAAAVRPDPMDSSERPATVTNTEDAGPVPTPIVDSPMVESTAKKSKKEKRKSKKGTTLPFDDAKSPESKVNPESSQATDLNVPYTSGPLTEEPVEVEPSSQSEEAVISNAEEPPTESVQEDPEPASISKKSIQKEKMKSKKAKSISWSEPEVAVEQAGGQESELQSDVNATEGIQDTFTEQEIPSLSASTHQDSGYQSRVLPEQSAENQDLSKLTAVLEQEPAGPVRRSPSPSDVDFAAIVVAGLEDAGFDSKIVTDNSNFLQHSPTQSTVEPEAEAIFTTTSRKKAKKGKKNREASQGGSNASPAPEQGEAGTIAQPNMPSPSDPSFDAIVAAGLAAAGLSAASGRSSPTEALPLEPEDDYSWMKRPKKKKGRNSQPGISQELSSADTRELPATEPTTPANGLRSREIDQSVPEVRTEPIDTRSVIDDTAKDQLKVDDVQQAEIAAKGEWDTQLIKKGKKGKKGKKAQPESLSAKSAEPSETVPSEVQLSTSSAEFSGGPEEQVIASQQGHKDSTQASDQTNVTRDVPADMAHNQLIEEFNTEPARAPSPPSDKEKKQESASTFDWADEMENTEANSALAATGDVTTSGPVEDNRLDENEENKDSIDETKQLREEMEVRDDDEWTTTTPKSEKGKKGKKGKRGQKSGTATPTEKELGKLTNDPETISNPVDVATSQVTLPVEHDYLASSIPSRKSSKKGKKGKKSSGSATPATDVADAIKDIGVEAATEAIISKALETNEQSKESRTGRSETTLENRPIEEVSRTLSPLDENASRRPSGSEIADLFPGLERFKRRAPVSMRALEPKEKRIHLPDKTTSDPSPSTGQFIPGEAKTHGESTTLSIPVEHDLHTARSDRSLRDVQEPTWGFPSENRDSAMQIDDSPTIPQGPIGEQTVRDSGYHDTPVTPTLRQPERLGGEEPVSIQGSPAREGDGNHMAEQTPVLTTTPPLETNETARTSKDVSEEWNLPVKKKRESQGSSTRALGSPGEEATTPQRPISRAVEDSPQFPNGSPGMTTPSAVDSTTKQRASYLFKSSPSVQFGTPTESPTTDRMRETPRGQNASPISAPPSEQQAIPSVEEQGIAGETPSKSEEASLSVFGDGPTTDAERQAFTSTPTRHLRSPSVPLDTIREYSPDESPLSKKNRDISDVGAPERGVKSRRKGRLSLQGDHSSQLQRSPPRTPLGKKQRDTSPLSTDEIIESMPWPEIDEEKGIVGTDRHLTLSPLRGSLSQRHSRSASRDLDPVKPSPRITSPLSAVSERSGGSSNKFKTPEHLRPLSSGSNRSATPPLRRVDRSASGDLRAQAKFSDGGSSGGSGSAKPQTPQPQSRDRGLNFDNTPVIPGPSIHEPKKDKGKGRAVEMDDVYEGWGDVQSSPMSPTRPPSVRKRQSMQIMDLEAHIRMMETENQKLQEARRQAEENIHHTTTQRGLDNQVLSEQVEARDRGIRAKDAEIAQLTETLRAMQEELHRLTVINDQLSEANKNLSAETNERYATLQAESSHANKEWQASILALEALRAQHDRMKSGYESVVRDEIESQLSEKNAEIQRLDSELQAALVTIQRTKSKILSTKEGETFLTVRDEDYFDTACQKLCEKVQGWVLRFSKLSDKRKCLLSSQINDEKTEGRLDNAILDGSEVDVLLEDRQKRRDVFMSVVMTMVWEFVFTRYLFGMDRDQRQKLKALEKQLSEVGPPRAVSQWRAITLTLLSKREAFQEQRAQDTEAVVQEIYSTLARLLPPPRDSMSTIQDSLRNILKLAISLSIEMRTQRAEYIMLAPLQPDYDVNGDLVRKVHFSASLMNERSGETSSNEQLEQRGAVVRLVLFPLVVKKGNDNGEGEDEIVVCPAQVLVARPKEKKVVRVMSGALSMGGGNASTMSVDMKDAEDT